MSQETESNVKTGKTRMNISISKDCKARIAKIADTNHRSASQQAEHILELWYEENYSNNPNAILSKQN